MGEGHGWARLSEKGKSITLLGRHFSEWKTGPQGRDPPWSHKYLSLADSSLSPPLNMPTQAKKGKGRANALEAARESLRDWERAEPEEIADEEDHLEWLEAMSLALVRPSFVAASWSILTLSQTEWQGAGASEEEVVEIADRAYLAHSESLGGDVDDWPSWARPVFSDARDRALAAIAAREAEVGESRLRRLVELKEKRAARRHAEGDIQAGGAQVVGAQASDAQEGGAEEGGAEEGGAQEGGAQAAAPSLPTGDSSPTAPPKKKRKHGPQEGEEVAEKDPGDGWKAVEGGTYQAKTRMVSRSRYRVQSRADDPSVRALHPVAEGAPGPMRARAWHKQVSEVRGGAQGVRAGQHPVRDVAEK